MFHNKDYEEFKNELRKVITPDTVFVCIGTNKVIFDIFGPLCGSKLKRKNILAEALKVRYYQITQSHATFQNHRSAHKALEIISASGYVVKRSQSV